MAQKALWREPLFVRAGRLSTAGERYFTFWDCQRPGKSLHLDTPSRFLVSELDGDSLGGVFYEFTVIKSVKSRLTYSLTQIKRFM